MRVALLPTGRTEWHGLPAALGSLFPAHQFYALPDDDGFRSSGPFAGFTSCLLGQQHEDARVPEGATDLVGRAAQEALGDRHREAADAVMVLDDLELTNRHQPDRVVRVFRSAVEQHLVGLQGSRDRTARVLRQRVSFHLAVPMIEAWLFGDPRALMTAGVPAGVSPFIGPDLEGFQSLDLAYLAADEADCPCWIAQGRRRKSRPKWLSEQRGLHPKGYLQWLCLAGHERNCTTYDENDAGGALGTLDWAAVLASSRFQYLRAFLADLAEVLQEMPTTGRVVRTRRIPRRPA